MDPITTAIVSALAAGIGSVVPKIAEQAVLDGYNALKSLLKKKFGEKSQVVEAIDNLEANPESVGRQTTLHEEIVDAKADQNPEVLGAAEALLSTVKEQPGGETIVSQVVSGDRNIFTGTGDVTVTPQSED